MKWRYAIIAITVLAAYLRLRDLGLYSLWIDEASLRME